MFLSPNKLPSSSHPGLLGELLDLGLDSPATRTMDTVPYEFCESVCALFLPYHLKILKRSSRRRRIISRVLTSLNFLRRALPRKHKAPGLWSTAVTAVKDQRVRIVVDIEFRGGRWFYCMYSVDLRYLRTPLLFRDLEKLDRRHVRVRGVKISSTSNDYDGTLSSYQTQTSFKELVDFAKYAVPLVDCGHFIYSVYRGQVEEFSIFFSLFRNCVFKRVEIYELLEMREEVQDFMRFQLQHGCLRTLTIDSDGWSEEFQPAIEEFALNQPFHGIHNLSGTFTFGHSFFERFFWKSFGEELRRSVQISAPCSSDFTFRSLEGFQKELQVPSASGDGYIVWRRNDNVWIRASEHLKHRTLDMILVIVHF